jgi:ABC-type multidrug transport system fused ATPase/permease subunit
MVRARPFALLVVILAAAASRLVPHPPNFAPIAAMALFGGAYFSDRRQAFLVPLAAMFLSDLVIGLHSTIAVVYGSFALIVCIGFWLRRRRTVSLVAGATLAGSVVFFVITNFGVWALGSWYPKTLSGLMTAYIQAIPFFRNTVAGDLFYVSILFGGFALLERLFPVLREAPEVVGHRT